MKNKKILQKIIGIILIIITISIICMPKSFADITRPSPSEITGDEETEIEMTFMDSLVDMLTKIGAFAAVGVMMVIGIKYMTGSLEEKAEYKKTMMPYIIGCILIFGASIIAPKMMDIFKDVEEAEDLGNIILGIIQVVGSFLSVGVIMILGIRYMIGSTEERASYKKTMLPYLIGAVLLFSAVNITAAVVEMTQDAVNAEDSGNKAPTCPICGNPMSRGAGGTYRCPRPGCKTLE